MQPSDVPVIPLLLALGLAIHGLRKKSLSPSGAFAAFTVGLFMMSADSSVFGISLIVFYLTGSRATKVGKALKSHLEEGHQEAGYRTGWQVFCNSLSAFIASAVWTALFSRRETGFEELLLPGEMKIFRTPYTPDAWCPLSREYGSGWSRWLVLATLGHFACCLGDTLASELGILSKSPPILITTFSRVPPGTNGGVSLVGTLASLSGGVVMGLTVAASLIWESSACRRAWPPLVKDLVLVGAAAGLFGSFIDSLMGATIQRTRYSNSTKKILQDDSTVSGKEDIKVVSGLNLLTNNQINLISSIVTALATAALA